MGEKRMFGKPFKKGGKKKPLRGIREFKSNGTLARAIGKMMRGMRLHDLAGDIIRANKLAPSEGGRQILRLGLQKAFLQGIWRMGKRGDIASQGEKAMFQLICDAETIRSAVWCAFTERTTIKKTENIFSAVAQTMQIAQSEFKGSKPKRLQYFKTIEQNAKASVSTIRSEIAGGTVGHAESLNEKQLLWVARIGEKMIEMLSAKLPADSKTGMALIENIAKTKLGESRND